jgi:DNA polymerase sigma
MRPLTLLFLVSPRAIFNFLRGLLRKRLPNLECFLMGSFPLKTYLPDSDLDMTISVSGLPEGEEGGEMEDEAWLVRVNEALCRAAVGQSPGGSAPPGKR